MGDRKRCAAASKTWPRSPAPTVPKPSAVRTPHLLLVVKEDCRLMPSLVRSTLNSRPARDTTTLRISALMHTKLARTLLNWKRPTTTYRPTCTVFTSKAKSMRDTLKHLPKQLLG